MNLRERCQKVYQTTCQWGFLSVRALAQATNLSKSSVHRLSQKIKHRQNHPESLLWETPEGYQWLRLLVFATIYLFGIKHGVGSEALSEKFHLLRLNSQIGISPTALRRLEVEMRSQILAYAEQQHQEVKLTNSKLEILAGADETFFPGMNGIILVLMDLVSGYIILEQKTSNRKYQTWFDQVQTALMGIGQQGAIKSLVSDRAKALIQLAVKGIGCQSIPDLFHAMRCLSRSIGARLGGQLARTKKQLQKTQREITKRHLAKKPISAQLNQHLSWLQQQYQFIETGLETYRSYVHQISILVHPFTIDESKFQTGTNVAKMMRELLPLLASLGQTYQLQSIEKALEQFSSQILGIAAGIDLWWQGIEQSLLQEEVDALTKNWLLTCLLPEVYWRSLVSKTKNPALKEIYQKAYRQAHQQLLAHPLTGSLKNLEIDRWRDWSTLMVAKFQRTTSAIEGRNGYLSRLYHSGRGLSQKDLEVLSIIHNFDLHRADGSTAAQRFFGSTFPPLFSWLVVQMGDLPASRKSRKLRDVSASVA